MGNRNLQDQIRKVGDKIGQERKLNNGKEDQEG